MLKLAIIGCGQVTQEMHLPAFASLPRVSIVALCDTNVRKLNEVANLYGVDARFRDYRKMLKETDIDAVCVCTPNYLHASMAIDSVKAGKHVLVEKPVATSLAEVKRMSAATAKSGRIMMVEQAHRFIPLNETAHGVISSGVLGKIHGFRARVGSMGPAGWSPTGKWFYRKREAFGGALADIGIHIIDTVRWVTGKKIALVKAFTAKLGRRGDVEDNAVLAVETADGLLGTIEASWTQGPMYFGYQIICEKGRLEVGFDSGVCALTRAPKGRVEFSVPAASVRGGAFKYFADCALKGEKPFVDIDEGGRSLAVVLAGYRSAAAGKAARVKY